MSGRDRPSPEFQVALSADALTVDEGGRPRSYPLGGTHAEFLDLFEAVARDFGLRRPLARVPFEPGPEPPGLRPILTEPVDPAILYGYGDPCVVQVSERDYRLLVTSNDAPDAFPILASIDLEHWRLTGFVFPNGQAPPWAVTGPEVSDFWAPELHRVGGAWWVCFTARTHDGGLAIGLARSASPDGPFAADPEPLVSGGVIDAHVLVDADGQPWLVWKRDDNDVWPGRLAALLHRHPGLAPRLFDGADLRTAAFTAALWPVVRDWPPMRRFFVLQTLIEAVGEDLDRFIGRLRAAADIGDPAITEILATLHTRIFMQRLSPDGRRLEGEARVILENDLPWEGHLIEGVWITRDGGRYHLLYAGNDFSTPRYGIGAAVAEHPTGPYRKRGEPLLRSTAQWWGPGHPSVVCAPDGGRRMFLHAFQPGQAGYKAFRALLTLPIAFEDDRIVVR